MNIYIINKNEHLGPYSEEDLFSFYRQGTIGDSTLLWVKDGDLKIKYCDFKTQLEKKEKRKTFLKRPQKDQKEQGWIPPIPLSEQVAVKSKQKDLVKKTLLALVILGLSSLVIKLISDRSSLIRPSKMSKDSYYQAMTFLDNAEAQEDFRIYLNKNLNSFWIITKSLPEGEVATLHFKSEKNKILSDKAIEFSTQFKIQNNKFIFIDDLSFERGRGFREGIYRVSLASKELFRLKHILVSLKNEGEFLSSLFQYHKKRSLNQNEFLLEIEQKYQTLFALTRELIGKLEKGQIVSVDAFTKAYESKYGPIFTSFVITNENDFKLLLQKKYTNIDIVYEKYFELSNFARKFGLISYNAIHKHKNLKRLKSKLESFVSH
jgi:hypothetical protein